MLKSTILSAITQSTELAKSIKQPRMNQTLIILLRAAIICPAEKVIVPDWLVPSFQNACPNAIKSTETSIKVIDFTVNAIYSSL